VAFSQATITSGPTCATDGDMFRVEWTSSDPDGTIFQVYLDGRLVWFGSNRSVLLPMPGTRVSVQIGTVGATEGPTDFSSSLPAIPGSGNKVRLTWEGGRFIAPDTVQFRVFMNEIPGGAIGTTPSATINVAPGGIYLDGYGVGGWNGGSWGYASVQYSWTTGPLLPGSYTFLVRAVDAAGNQGSAAIVFKTIAAPPRPPAANADGSRLTYTYNSGTRVPTLAWNAAP